MGRLPKAVLGRDRDIVRLRADGWTLRMIAHELGVSHETVRKSLQQARKDGVRFCGGCGLPRLHSRRELEGRLCETCEQTRRDREGKENQVTGRPSVMVYGCLVCGREMSKNQARDHLCWGKGEVGKIVRRFMLTTRT